MVVKLLLERSNNAPPISVEIRPKPRIQLKTIRPRWESLLMAREAGTDASKRLRPINRYDGEISPKEATIVASPATKKKVTMMP